MGGQARDVVAELLDEFAAVAALYMCAKLHGQARDVVAELLDVLVFLRQTVTDQLMPTDHFFFAVQVLDAAGVWASLDQPRQVVAAVAALYMCNAHDLDFTCCSLT